VTYALIAASGGWSAGTLCAAVLGTAALLAFALNERRSTHPMLPPRIFANRQFSAANLVTFVVYAALGGVFFMLVMDLQVVAGFSALLAGSALLPLTAIMLVFSAQASALAQRIGPRLPMTLGPLVAASGVLLMLRIGPDASFVIDVLPAVTVFGVGLALLVAPLTTTVLAAADVGNAGIASGINNAVARAAGLLAVAVLPVLAGISGDDYERPQSFAAGFATAVLISAGLLACGGLLAALAIRNPARTRVAGQVPVRSYCAMHGPALQPAAGHSEPAADAELLLAGTADQAR
jgi:predicted MFS family arabinose efflux permease